MGPFTNYVNQEGGGRGQSKVNKDILFSLKIGILVGKKVDEEEGGGGNCCQILVNVNCEWSLS